MKDSITHKIVWFILIIAGLAYLLYGCKSTDTSFEHCYNDEWQDVLVVDLPKGGNIIINGEQFVIPKKSEVVITGNVIN